MKIIRRLVCSLIVVIFLSACIAAPIAPSQASETTPAATLTPAPSLTTKISTPTSTEVQSDPTYRSSTTATNPLISTTSPTCQLDLVSQPPWPAEGLLPNELDTATGLHMTGIPQLIELATYSLEVTGKVDHPLSLSYDELRCMRKVTDNPVLECPSVFTDYASWTGVPIKDILELAGVQATATKITLISADGYTINLPLETANDERNFLAYQVDGQTLPVLHGFPLRAVLPDMWGSYWLKWLVEIQVS